METLPLVSIIIPCYNRERYIAQAIESALSQDYTNLEIVISDNCSTDNTPNIIKKYVHDPRVKFSQNNSNIGMIPNFRKATEQIAQGKYFIYICSDDYLINTSFISQAVKLIINNDNVSLVWGKNVGVFEGSNKKIFYTMPNFNKEIFRNGIDIFLDYSYKTFWLGFGACLMDSNLIKKSPYNEDTTTNLELLIEGNAMFIEQDSYIYRLHDNASNEFNYGSFIIEISKIEKIFIKAIRKFPERNAEIIRWKEHVLIYLGKTSLKSLVVKNQADYRKTHVFFSKNYPFVIEKTSIDLSFLIRKIIISRIISIPILFKITSFLFPNRRIFKITSSNGENFLIQDN
jgi:glycosyltransferase involved in cell wall biosynthesis